MDLTALFKNMDLAQCLLTLSTVALWLRVDKQRVDCIREKNDAMLELLAVNKKLSHIEGFLQGQGLITEHKE